MRRYTCAISPPFFYWKSVELILKSPSICFINLISWVLVLLFVDFGGSLVGWTFFKSFLYSYLS